ncbi:hypothetical protein ACFR9U_12335 [Halorientalis brevis]|uniref:Uncharacterized protein n=1 Tax=Halorientalis brevis TaxID=1126241 RepID=A0ABD6CC04_9EURY|nr:hypothetical protein [Halorientalis brevis]
MYDTKRLASGVGVLLSLWALVGLLVMSSGVGLAVSAPLSPSGGFVVEANYLGAEQSISTASKTRTTGVPAAKFRITKSYAEYLTLKKTLDVSDVPGLNGTMRLLIQSDTATLQGVTFRTNDLTASTARWRGFVLDERYNESRFEQFYSYAGPNPEDAPNTDDPMEVGGSTPGAVKKSEKPGFQLYNARIEMSSLTADQVQLSNLDLRVQWDVNSDGDYEYGT